MDDVFNSIIHSLTFLDLERLTYMLSASIHSPSNYSTTQYLDILGDCIAKLKTDFMRSSDLDF